MSSCSNSIKLNNTYKAQTQVAAETSKLTNSFQMKEVTVSARNSKAYTWEQHRYDVLSEEVPSKVNPLANISISNAIAKFEPNKLQIKYAGMLNVLPVMLSNIKLLEIVDYWYGTRYRYGGTTKSGIDCSAFVRAVYKVAFGIELPRTAREQYASVDRISATNLQEGDLVFFNTTGGVSHVGMYLSNNKFVHASSGKGVTVSDLFDSYYISRFLGAGRISANKETYIAAGGSN